MYSAGLERAMIDTAHWIEDFQKQDSTGTNFNYSHWSIVEGVNEHGLGAFFLKGPVEARKPRVVHGGLGPVPLFPLEVN